ncbi:DUF4340 domain-containing protein [Burkholderiales bacterium]|nr:DUF4340 domain-containing protein [Burkholderiales bacterium]
MKSRLLLNLLLIAVLALLGAYLFLNQEPEVVKSDRLVALDKNKIKRITIVKNSSFEMDFTRSQTTWTITKPFRARANAEVIKLVLDLAEAPIINEIKENSKDFGFEPPTYTVTLDQEIIKFGNINEVTNEQYVQVNKRTFLTKTHHGYNLPYDPIKVVDRRILGAEEIPIIFESKTWRAERGIDGIWSMTSETKNLPAIAPSKIKIWAMGWPYTTATETTITGKSPDYKFESIKVSFENGRQITVSIKKIKKGYLLRRSDEDILYKVGNDAGLRLIDPYEVARTL